VGVAAEVKRSLDAGGRPVLTDRLGDGGDVVVVEALS
jgi:hypothetical protein